MESRETKDTVKPATRLPGLELGTRHVNGNTACPHSRQPPQAV